MNKTCPAPDFGFGQQHNRCPPRSDGNLRPLALLQFRELFIIYGFGIALSVIIFLSEWLIGRRTLG